MVGNQNYYTVYGWMLHELDLRGNDLIVYALIYSFSKDGESEFKGSIAYIHDFTGLSARTVHYVLKRLLARGLIKKTERNSEIGSTNSYVMVPLAASDENFAEGANFADPPCNFCTPPMQILQTPHANSAPNNYIDNNSDKDNDKRKKERKKNINISMNKTRAPARVRDAEDFSHMSDEELLSWGENTQIDWDDAAASDRFYRHYEECRRRGRESTWAGKIVKGHGVFERLKSHEEILSEGGVKGALKTAFLRFLRESYLHGHLVSNEKLIDIICRLDNRFGSGAEADTEKIEALNAAISGGYFDIRH